MGRLSNSKIMKAFRESPANLVNSGLNKVLGMSMDRFKKNLSKEDPVKVKAFLADLSTDPTMPEEARQAFQKLLDEMTKSDKPLDEIMQEQTAKSISDLETTLKEQCKPKT